MERVWKFSLLFVFFSLFSVFLAFAASKNTGYPVPRFVSLKYDQTIGRFGPGLEYPEKYSFNKKNLPVQIINEYYDWFQVRDMKGEESWIRGYLLSSRRFGVTVRNGLFIYANPDNKSKKLARLNSGVILELKDCKSDKKFCKVAFEKKVEGYLEKYNLYGLEQSER